MKEEEKGKWKRFLDPKAVIGEVYIESYEAHTECSHQ